MNKKAIFLMGPTAVGKTALAMRLAKLVPELDLISVDSAMVYRGMDIGTGKPSQTELAQFPHQLIDICDPSEAYSAARFCEDASRCMQRSWQQQRIPLLVGGTMLYFKALQFGLAELPSADAELRAQLTQEAQTQGWGALHARLAQLDPATAARLKIQDTQRIQRALEINILTGKTLAQHFAVQRQNKIDYTLHSFALLPSDRATLHNKIAERFEQMLQNGLIAEVEKLFARADLHAALPAIRAVGYRQVWAYLDGKIDYDSMRAQAIAATRQLAKRQHTWLRSWPKVINIEGSEQTALDVLADSVINLRNH